MLKKGKEKGRKEEGAGPEERSTLQGGSLWDSLIVLSRTVKASSY